MFKKVLATLLVVIMTMSLCACGGKGDKDTNIAKEGYYNETGYPICDEEITLTVMASNSAEYELDETAAVALIREKFGIKFDIEDIDGEAWSTKFQTKLTTDRLPDLIIGTGDKISQAAEWASEGYFLDFSKYLDIMPNFKAYLEANPLYATYAYAGSEGIYAIPRTTEVTTGLLAATLINTKWLENVGKEMPTTLEELKDVLRAFKEKDANGNGDPNDEIPLLLNYANGNSAGCTDWDEILNAFGIYSRSDKVLRQVDENGKVYSGLVTDEYKAYLKFMKELYEEDLLWADAFVASDDEGVALIEEDRAGVFSTKGLQVNLQAETDTLADYEMLMGLTSDYSQVSATATGMPVTTWVMCYASADTKYPEAIARLVDAGFDLELNDSVFQAYIDGETVEYEDITLPDGTVVQKANPLTLDDTTTYPKRELPNFFFRYVNSVENTIIEKDFAPEDYTDEFIKEYGLDALFLKRLAADDLELISMFPTALYTPEENTKHTTYLTDVTNLIAVWKSDFITGKKDIDGSWNDYLKALDAAGLKKDIAIEQAAYDRVNK